MTTMRNPNRRKHGGTAVKIVVTGPFSAGAHGSVDGATALQPGLEADPAVSSLIERDPSVNKSLLLRLIAGVRGL